ncbi:hypothetical protein C5167_030404 [Papaver somniferum]|nr:hypothetical protein C5167_030404 [Papaver somniferum]
MQNCLNFESLIKLLEVMAETCLGFEARRPYTARVLGFEDGKPYEARINTMIFPYSYKPVTEILKGPVLISKNWLKHLETVIKSRIPGLQSLINKSIAELEAKFSRFGKPFSSDAGGKLYSIMEICRLYDGIFKEHLDGMNDVLCRM